jgi:hypothetical protein
MKCYASGRFTGLLPRDLAARLAAVLPAGLWINGPQFVPTEVLCDSGATVQSEL